MVLTTLPTVYLPQMMKLPVPVQESAPAFSQKSIPTYESETPIHD